MVEPPGISQSDEVNELSKIFKLEEAEKVEDPGTRTMHWLMNAGLGAEKMRVVVYDFEPNLRFDKVHYHDERESIYVILGGTAIVHLNGEEHILEANTVAYLSPGDIHGVVGTGEDGLKMLEAWAPAERDTTYMDYEGKE